MSLILNNNLRVFGLNPKLALSNESVLVVLLKNLTLKEHLWRFGLKFRDYVEDIPHCSHGMFSIIQTVRTNLYLRTFLHCYRSWENDLFRVSINLCETMASFNTDSWCSQGSGFEREFSWTLKRRGKPKNYEFVF